jgi:hypothetical protein
MRNADRDRVEDAMRAMAFEARCFVVQVWRSRANPAHLQASVRAIGDGAPGRAPDYVDNVERLGQFLTAAVLHTQVGGHDD